MQKLLKKICTYLTQHLSSQIVNIQYPITPGSTLICDILGGCSVPSHQKTSLCFHYTESQLLSCNWENALGVTNVHFNWFDSMPDRGIHIIEVQNGARIFVSFHMPEQAYVLIYPAVVLMSKAMDLRKTTQAPWNFPLLWASVQNCPTWDWKCLDFECRPISFQILFKY